MEIKIYKIYNPVLGKYSKGGSTNYDDTKYFWSKKGKTWNDIGHVKLHLNLQYNEKYDYDAKSYKITSYKPLLKQYIKDKCVVIEITRDGQTEKPVADYIKSLG